MQLSKLKRKKIKKQFFFLIFYFLNRLIYFYSHCNADVTCIKFGGHGRFSVSMITSRILPTLPVIENENIENLSQCSVNIINPTTFEINLQESDMIKCGVHYCNSDSDINARIIIILIFKQFA